MKNFAAMLKKEAVLLIAAVCSAASMLAVPPDAGYATYIDARVLCLLFCLMSVVLGLEDCGLFAALAGRVLSGSGSVRRLILGLVLLPFFCSMLVTNDVALITFVPFAISVLELCKRREQLIKTVALQTLAANLGSMATPVGNPQNLFIYAAYDLSPGDFFPVVLPLAGISLVLLCAAALLCGSGRVSVELQGGAALDKKHLALWLGLLALCLLSVFKLLDYRILTAVILIFMLIFGRKLLPRVDYSLLATFVCFFVFAGNLGRIDAVCSLLQSLLGRSAMLTSLLASQVISNVPAAVLLSGFTEDWRGLLSGVDIGGLGTPIASLASLISLRLYMRSEGARPGRYLAVFTLFNVAGLLILTAVYALTA